MIKFFKRVWNYISTGANQKFDEKADPKVQLAQAIEEGQKQHRQLRENAANIIAQQKQTELQMNRSLEQLEKYNANARQAVKMAEAARQSGDAAKATEFERAAETIATQLIALEAQIEEQKALHYQATQAADQAKAAVAQNGELLQRKLAERNQLLSRLEQAKMQETMNDAMSQLSETVGQEVPTFNEVRDKIENRYAKAKGMGELTDVSAESRMIEIESAAANTAAQERLAQIREQLGITTAAPAEAESIPEVATATDPGTSTEAAPGQSPSPSS